MKQDIAELSIKVDSRSAKTAEKNLDGLSMASGRAEGATDKMSRSTGFSAKQYAGLAAASTLAATAIYQVVSAGFKYNRQMEQQLGGLTALSVATSSNIDSLGNHISLTQKYTLAAKDAAQTMRELEKINASTPHTLGQTSQIYKAMYVSMKNVGATTEDMIGITKTLSIAAGAAGIEFNSLLAGVDGLATGTVLANSDLGRFLGSLGITNKELKNSTDVVGLLNEKLGDFDITIDTMDTATSNLSNSWGKLTGELTKTAFENTKDNINLLASGLESATKWLQEYNLATMTFREISKDMGIAALEKKLALEKKSLELQKDSTYLERISRGDFSSQVQARAEEVEIAGRIWKLERLIQQAKKETVALVKKETKATVEVEKKTKKVLKQKKDLAKASADNYKYITKSIGSSYDKWLLDTAISMQKLAEAGATNVQMMEKWDELQNKRRSDSGIELPEEISFDDSFFANSFSNITTADLAPWQKTFTESTSQGLVNALQGGDMKSVVGSLFSDVGAAGLQNVLSQSLAGGMEDISKGEWVTAAIGIAIPLVSSALGDGQDDERALQRLIDANNAASQEIIDALNNQTKVFQAIGQEGTVSGLQVEQVSETYRNSIENIFAEARKQAADWSSKTHKKGYAAFDVYADSQESAISAIANLDEVFMETYNIYDGLKVGELNKVNAKFEAASSDYIAGIIGLSTDAVAQMESFEKLYDEITGGSKYSDIALSKAKTDIGFTDGMDSDTFLDGVINEFSVLDLRIQEFEAVLNNTNSTTEDLVNATNAVESAYGGSVENALNYVDSVNLVMSAQSQYTQSLANQSNDILGLAAQMNGSYDSFQQNTWANEINNWYKSIGHERATTDSILYAYTSATSSDLKQWTSEDGWMSSREVPTEVMSAITNLVKSGNTYKNAVDNVNKVSYDPRYTASIPRDTEVFSTSITTATEALKEFSTEILDSTIGSLQSVQKSSRGFIDSMMGNNTSYSGGLYEKMMTEAETLTAKIASGKYTSEDASNLEKTAAAAYKYGETYFQNLSGSKYEIAYAKSVAARRAIDVETTARGQESTLTNVVDELKLLRESVETGQKADNDIQTQIKEAQEEIAILMSKTG